MGYFDSIKENTALSAPEKKAAFNKQLGENKRSVYPNLILVMLSALGYTKCELAKRLGVSNAETSKMTTQSFCISPYNLVCLCTQVFGMSCHAFLFGASMAFVLPKSLALVSKTVARWSDYKKHECLEKIKDIRELNAEFCGPYKPTIEEVLTERIHEVASDQYCPPEDFLDEKVCSASKAPLRNYLNGTVSMMTTSTIMYLAFLTDNTVDYFLTADYTKYGEIGYRVGDSLMTVTDKITIKIIGELLQMPPYLRSNCIAHILYMDIASAS